MGLLRLASGFVAVLCCYAAAQQPVTVLHLEPNSSTLTHTLDGAVLSSATNTEWSLEADFNGSKLGTAEPLISLTDENLRTILEGRVAEEEKGAQFEFLLFTSYRKEPLSVEIPP
jgi:hypothetical protein